EARLEVEPREGQALEASHDLRRAGGCPLWSCVFRYIRHFAPRLPARPMVVGAAIGGWDRRPWYRAFPGPPRSASGPPPTAARTAGGDGSERTVRPWEPRQPNSFAPRCPLPLTEGSMVPRGGIGGPTPWAFS